jgi:hypothetical protein
MSEDGGLREQLCCGYSLIVKWLFSKRKLTSGLPGLYFIPFGLRLLHPSRLTTLIGVLLPMFPVFIAPEKP